MARTSVVLVLLLAAIGLASAASTLSMSNSANQRFEITKDTDLTISNDGTTFLSFLADDTTVFNAGVQLTRSQFSRPGAIRYQDSDLEAFLNGQWRSMTTSATRASLPSSKKAVVSRSAPLEGTAQVTANTHEISSSDSEWAYSVNGLYVVGSAELASAPVSSHVAVHPVSGFDVISIALQDSAVVTISCNQDCSEAGLQVAHMKLAGAESLEAAFTDEEYIVSTGEFNQSYSIERVSHSNCNSENAGSIEAAEGELMTCSAMSSRADGANLFAYLSVVPSSQF